MSEQIPDTYRQSPNLARQVTFKAWLAEHDRQVAAKAWADGYDAGHSDANPWGLTYPATTPNPYEGDRHVDQ